MKIKLCKKYPKIKTFEKNLSKAFPDASIQVKGCIGMCKKCKEQPVAKVDKKKLKVKKIEKLIDKIDAL
jgi:hypothetical protein